MEGALSILVVVVGLIVASFLVLMILVPVFKGIGLAVTHVGRFIGGEISDALRLVGAAITSIIFMFLVLGNVLIFRWSAAAHFGRSVQGEFAAAGASIYRILVGHPARLLGMRSLVDGIENRLPAAVAAAPASDRPSTRTGQFQGYKIIGSLPGGGSGGKLYIAKPDEVKAASFERAGQREVDQVVIKSFSLRDGSSLPQIVRESRALDAAKKLGLVLDHELAPDRFFYVMRYVPGEPLGIVTQQLHAESPDSGLDAPRLARALAYIEGLVATLNRYHQGGLWHKDVKPDNIIVHDGQAHLVDFGLITPLRSAMTLTTHGTEYFRDPEMVRMALKGVKVHEVDGAKFDVYAAGAVLYSVVENSFPAHGGLSQITKRCPEAVRWIIRRAMAEYDRRYATADAMLADLRFVSAASDAFALKPADLPSVASGDIAPSPADEREAEFAAAVAAAAASPRPRVQPAAHVAPEPAKAATHAGRPKLRVTNWWTGRYEPAASTPTPRPAPCAPETFVVGMGIGPNGPFFGVRRTPPPTPAPAPTPRNPGPRRPASEQIVSARTRAAQRRGRALSRMSGRRSGRNDAARYAAGMNAGAFVAMLLFLAATIAFVALIIRAGAGSDTPSFASQDPLPLPPQTPAEAEIPALAVLASSEIVQASDTPESPIAPDPAPAGVTTRVLVVSDLLPPLPEETSAAVTRAIDALRQGGLELLGTLPGLSESSADVALRLTAEARRVRGQAPLDSDEAGRAIVSWLDAPTDADAVLWIVPPLAPTEPAGVYVFASTARARDAETLRRIIAGEEITGN